jgi:hypothetical protein
MTYEGRGCQADPVQVDVAAVVEEEGGAERLGQVDPGARATI